MGALRQRDYQRARSGVVPAFFGASLLSAVVNRSSVIAIAWTLVRYDFPGRKIVDALIDMPFALPTAVVRHRTEPPWFASTGWIGQYLEPLGIKVAYTWIGITVALTLIGMPFVGAHRAARHPGSATRPRGRR